MPAPRSRRVVWSLLVVVSLALAACGRTQATEQPDPPSWFVGVEDRTTHGPGSPHEARLAVDDTEFVPATLVVHSGEALRIDNYAAKARSFTVSGMDLAVVAPGDWTVVTIRLEPGRYTFWSSAGPLITGTLVVR